MSELIPKWHREIEIFEKIKPIMLLEGNVLDNYFYPGDENLEAGSLVRLPGYLHFLFKSQGYENIVFYDGIRGFYNKCERGYIEEFSNLIGGNIQDDGYIRAEFKDRGSNTKSAPRIIRDAVTQSEQLTVVILDFASRYITGPSSMDQTEIDSFTILLQAAMDASEVVVEDEVHKNLIVLITNKINDIPAWFYLDNPNVKTIMLRTPSKEERENFVKGDQFANFFDEDIYQSDILFYEDKPEELEKIQDRFIGLTEGFSCIELNGLCRLCENQKIHIKDMCDVIDLYKFGIRENPWKALNSKQFTNAYSEFEKRVKGQPNALTKTLDIVKRAITGMSDITSSSHGKPKGVLFFAGPTGTGKTETAKTLAEKLFGDESACIRFDMSEFSQSHSDQRLLGAPPGYVGYESGGQLTNAVKNNPFCILLFDEIEKAHPSILDKFLQILEDGRMTDGKGETVYFSETIIIFTSNLGIYKTNRLGERELAVKPDMDYEAVQKEVRSGIEDYFKLDLGRPEILNRIGENIVVFDFIREEVAENILKSQIDKIITNMETDLNISLSLSDSAFETLKENALKNLENGGRGIGNIVESLFVNPLSRYMFDNDVFNNANVKITSINNSERPYSMECNVELKKEDIE